jgi:hypothetical protein
LYGVRSAVQNLRTSITFVPAFAFVLVFAFLVVIPMRSRGTCFLPFFAYATQKANFPPADTGDTTLLMEAKKPRRYLSAIRAEINSACK